MYFLSRYSLDYYLFYKEKLRFREFCGFFKILEIINIVLEN